MSSGDYANNHFVQSSASAALSGPEVKSYYFAGAQLVAMRNASGLYYFVADHLGSTSVTLDANGNKIGEMKYYPFGETRSGSAPTPPWWARTTPP